MLVDQSAQSEMYGKRRVRRRAGTKFRRFGGDQSGAVLVETAVVMLILVPLLIGLAELSEALTLKRRVETAAATGVDLVTRAADETGVTIAYLDDVGLILQRIVEPGVRPSVPIRFSVVNFTIVETDKNPIGKKGEPEGSYKCGFMGSVSQNLPEEILRAMDPGDRIVLFETQDVFISRFAWFITGSITLRGTSYFAPRIGNEIDLTLKTNQTLNNNCSTG